MPRLIAAAEQDIDITRALAEALVSDGGEVRCYLEVGDHELSSMGCHTAIGRLDDEMNLEGAMYNAHTFIALLPEPLLLAGSEDLEMIEKAGVAMARAAAGSNVEQTILVLPSAVEHPEDPAGSTYRAIRQAFEGQVSPLAILITGLVWSPERPPLNVEPSAMGHVSVVSLEGLVEALVAIDDREATEEVFHLGGTAMPITELGDKWPGGLIAQGSPPREGDRVVDAAGAEALRLDRDKLDPWTG